MTNTVNNYKYQWRTAVPPKFESTNDPSKDKVEQSAQRDQIDDLLDEQLGLTEAERALDPDREGLDVRAQKGSELIDKTTERREPPVVVEGEDKGKVVDDTPLGKALRTIEEQGTRLHELETRIASGGERGEVRREREPQVEVVEILPGLRLPKDQSKWPIKLSDRDLVALGWNDEAKGPAEVLRILGNALYMFVAETVPDMAGTMLETRFTERENASKTQQTFEGLYPHLVKHRDIVSLVERNERQNPNSSLRGKFGNDYYQELGRLGEAKIADIRGITIEQYRAEAVSQRRSSAARGNDTKARAVSTGGGVRPGTRRTETDFEKDSADL